MAKRRNAVYHQQAIYEALMLGTEFYKVPDTDALRNALEANDKKAIKEETENLKEPTRSFYNKEPTIRK